MRTIFAAALVLQTASAFSVLANGGRQSATASPLAASTAATTDTNTDELLKPQYDIEAIPTRIGHGFDIHRMAPIQEAGQPVVIGGVEITHKDQKVRTVMLLSLCCHCDVVERHLFTYLHEILSNFLFSFSSSYSGPTRTENMSKLVEFMRRNWV